MDSASIKRAIAEGGAEIERLRAQVNEAFEHRGEGKLQREKWAAACEALHARYNELAFPGGYDRVRERLDAGDPETVEAAMCFLEVRPYFFRSGYMFKDLLRRVKRVALSESQAVRLNGVIEKYAEWQREKKQNDG